MNVGEVPQTEEMKKMKKPAVKQHKEAILKEMERAQNQFMSISESQEQLTDLEATL